MKKKIVIQTESFERIESIFLNNDSDLDWNCLFVLPQWLKTWWDLFGENQDPEILAGYREGKLIGLAPLRIQETTARFIGGENVCDYQDIITASNHRSGFLISILTHLKEQGIHALQLGTLRPESVSLTRLPDLAEQMGYFVESHQAAFSYEIALPRTWESYLSMLNGKQRHEIRRKIRRLNEAGHVQFRVLERWEDISEQVK